mgnify:CR=1 FL=1
MTEQNKTPAEIEIVAFTGHRPNGFKDWPSTQKKLSDLNGELAGLLRVLKPAKAFSGMALGFDMLAAKLCVQLGIPFIAAVPFRGQELLWPEADQVEYHKLLFQAEQVRILQESHYGSVYDERNEHMVDNSTRVIAAYAKHPGGTKNCIDYARLAKRPIHFLDL